MTRPRIVTVIVPVFNESEAVGPFLRAMEQTAATALTRFGGMVALELLFVDDGSTDDTLTRLLSMPTTLADLQVMELSRNFGKEAAMSAGLAEASGDAVTIIDVDLQDPPDLILDMIAHWLDGAKVVLARRTDRSGDGATKRRTASWFYALHNLMSDVPIPHNVGDFRLMDRDVVDEVNRLPENRRFMKGIFAWVGFAPVVIEYKRAPRSRGMTKFSGGRLWRLAVEGITSFSAAPLVVWTVVGAAISALSFVYASFIIVRTLVVGVDVPGYASLLVGILFLGGIQVLGIGVVGQYVSRIYAEVKRRPPYVVAQRHERRSGTVVLATPHRQGGPGIKARR